MSLSNYERICRGLKIFSLIGKKAPPGSLKEPERRFFTDKTVKIVKIQ